jgi:hypothetical protein
MQDENAAGSPLEEKIEKRSRTKDDDEDEHD